MKNSNYSRAKVLTLIPVIVLAVTVIFLVLASILEVPTGRGVLYTIFGAAGLMSIFFLPLPCLVMSVVGTVFASKAGKEGVAEAKKFFILGIIEILAGVVCSLLAILMFLVGMGV